MLNILTFDVEEWFHGNYEDLPDYARGDGLPSTLDGEMEWILEVLSEHAARATFFCLGCVAERHPHIIRAIAEHGHELACHSYAHRLARRQTVDGFRTEVECAVNAIQQIAGMPVTGFRAPSWSLTLEDVEHFEVLLELGFQYDASVIPFRTSMYGDPRVPAKPSRLALPGGTIWEIPVSTLRVGRVRVPFSGGFYAQVLPYWLIERGLRTANRQGLPGVTYFHPREFGPDDFRLPLRFTDRIVQHTSVRSIPGKLRRLVRAFSFQSMGDWVRSAAGRSDFPILKLSREDDARRLPSAAEGLRKG